ncbi:MAG: dynamin family protein [Candidatus Acidiferrales bacterium]
MTRQVPVEMTLNHLAELAKKLSSDHVFEDAKNLAERIAEGRFYVACIGQFKRGKSTLLGALLGDRVLPAGVLPVTAVATVIRYGSSRAARVRFRGGEWADIAPEDVTDYVSEEHNSENVKGVAGIEVFVPSPLLADGMCFVDTPGLGSSFAGNTTATQAFIPHIDAAIVVVGVDPPITAEELAVLEQVGKQVQDLVVVLNKADRDSDKEREVVKSFTSAAIEKRLGRPIRRIFEVSAEERLQNRGPERDWEKLIVALETLVRQSGRSLVRAAGERGLQRLSEELLVVTLEEREALVRPIEESERRIESLRKTISQAEQSLRDMGYLFMAEQQHLSDVFLDQRKEFLQRASPNAEAEFSEALKELPRRFGPRFRRRAMSVAQVIAERHVLPWLEGEQVRAEQEYRKVEARFVNMANDFLKKLFESGAPEFARMPNALASNKGLRVPSRFTFEQLLRVSLPASPLRYVADIALGATGASFTIERDAREFLHHLMDMNSARVQSDVVNRAQESRGQLDVEIRKLLHEVTRIAERALEHARVARTEGASAVQARLCELKTVEEELHSIIAG